MKRNTEVEDAYLEQLKPVLGILPEREYKFLQTRRFRFDFAWPELKIAVEIEGGVWSGGRHVSPIGFTNDCTKYNLAVIDGWKVLRFPTSQVKDGTALNLTSSLFSHVVGGS